MSTSEVPVLLGRICSLWRAISLSTPRPWATLHVCEPYSPPNPGPRPSDFRTRYDRRLEAMKAWLVRSGNCPLSISLTSAQQFGDLEDDDIPWGSFCRAVIPLASRWQKMRFITPAPILVEALSHLAEDDVPILHSFTFRSVGVRPGELQPWSSVQILHGRNVSDVSISGTINPATALKLRWAELTSLTLEDLSPHPFDLFTGDSVLKLLSHCPALETCRLSVVDWRTHSPTATSIVECPCLTSLHLVCTGDPAASLQRIFKLLLVPRLRHFALEGTNPFDIDSDSPYFLAGLKELESLSIHSSVLHPPALFSILRSLPPTVHRLEITLSWDSAVSNDILALLTPSDAISPFCPALRELVIKQCTISDEALLHCVKSRLASGFCERLEDVQVWFAREMQFDILPSLQDFVDAGVRIALCYYPPRMGSEFSPWLGLEEQPPYY
ncbi:hypothetical protein B0H16DRAFT_1529184 [Mycena metata]|uniref:F-box domain-containing protein n=1 Tax=Mycena metata TaxID=1033252 RepID=A0AAD7NIU5_9AGAR|nr:hypothetical protein B0H16DRAFT_1529184 [Mycena metata]